MLCVCVWKCLILCFPNYFSGNRKLLNSAGLFFLLGGQHNKCSFVFSSFANVVSPSLWFLLNSVLYSLRNEQHKSHVSFAQFHVAALSSSGLTRWGFLPVSCDIYLHQPHAAAYFSYSHWCIVSIISLSRFKLHLFWQLFGYAMFI